MVGEILECLKCKKKWDNNGVKRCPYCDSTEVQVMGDEEDIDAMQGDYEDQFSEKDVAAGKKKTTGSSVKEKSGQQQSWRDGDPDDDTDTR